MKTITMMMKFSSLFLLGKVDDFYILEGKGEKCIKREHYALL